MQSEYYNFQANSDALFFEFQSVSETKIINKIIVYTPIPNSPNFYNLALGDVLDNGEISDLTISNNDDLDKVIATVIQTMFRFFEKYPENYIYFKGSTPERTRLYRIIISKELNQAQKIFEIYGMINATLRPFELNCPYESFVITLRAQLN
ncbi:MAG: hypothetical protein MUE30_00535 [Spirosomaceae bacterium]|jgi:hypothetical protein|nr:hypothetical protein [Spirosomataceae bacterium]